MKLFPRYVPSVEEEKREKEDRARHIGQDLFILAVVFTVICIGILCGGHGRYSYDFYPYMRSFDVIASCIGLAWSAFLTLYYFLMKPTRKKLIAMYVLDTLTVCLLIAYFLIGAYTAHVGRFPDMPFTLGDFLFETLNVLPFVVYFPVSHLICYRKSKLDLSIKPNL